jgi:type III restriction enzyme
MNPRATLTADQFSADQLVLRVSESVDPAQFDLDAYDDFLDEACDRRPYQRAAVETALRFLCSGRYTDSAALARESYAASSDLRRRYTSADALIERLPFPDRLACTLDLATGTGKSFALYAIARVMLNEGLVNRVLVLCPSLTIEEGLLDKFNQLTADSELTDTLPLRSDGIAIPNIVSAGATVQPGDICVENIHAVYERTGSSNSDSFGGQGERALVMSDEAHHVLSPEGADLKRWYEFLVDPAYGFRYHVGASGTCYVGNEYFTDVIYRYAIRDAINDQWVKEVFYLAEDDSTTDHERFQKLLAQHEKNRKTYRQVKPLTIAVTRSIKEAEQLHDALVSFLAEQPGMTPKAAAGRVLIVTSAPKHAANVRELAVVDDASNPVEWIVSVSMLTEGWDVQNVFQIYPHEKRAFNSKLLIAQVLGRGLRRPPAVASQPAVHVFNHQKWGTEIDGYVAEVLDQETTITQRPVMGRSASHFTLHDLEYSAVPTGIQAQDADKPREIRKLALHPQGDATEQTIFRSATDATRSDVLSTHVVQKRYPVDDVVAEVRQRMRDHDQRTGGDLAQIYPKARVKQLIRDALVALGLSGDEISQENRQLVLSAFGSLRQQRLRPGAALTSTPIGLREIQTSSMGPIRGRISGLTSTLALFYDEESRKLGTEEDGAALDRAEAIDVAIHLFEVPNAYDFRSPTNVVLASHTPERQFIRRLVNPKTAAKLQSWIKAPDVGFYSIEFSYKLPGGRRRKHGYFNPDFFLLLDASDTVVVVEIKADTDDSPINAGKITAATAHFAVANNLLAQQGSERRYLFHLVSPVDYDRFFEALRGDDLGSFRSTLQATLQSEDADEPEEPPSAGAPKTAD